MVITTVMKRRFYTRIISFYIYRLEHRPVMFKRSIAAYAVCFPALHLGAFLNIKIIQHESELPAVTDCYCTF